MENTNEIKAGDLLKLSGLQTSYGEVNVLVVKVRTKEQDVEFELNSDFDWEDGAFAPSEIEDTIKTAHNWVEEQMSKGWRSWDVLGFDGVRWRMETLRNEEERANVPNGVALSHIVSTPGWKSGSGRRDKGFFFANKITNGSTEVAL